MNGGYLKRYGPSDPGSPELEALGLRWLGAVAGGVRAARVLRVGQRELELERLPNSGPADGAPEAFGRALARTHAAGAPWHGAPPAGWDQPAGSIGLAPMAFVPAGRAGLPWGEFYATYRVEPYVRLARDAHQFGSGEVAVFEVLCARLAAGEFDAPQPALVPGGAARLHGDLWAGNVMWLPPAGHTGDDPAGPWTGAAVIDPAAHGGHAETDLAMLDLFGCAGLGRIVAAYHEVSPLAAGWQGRVALHQVYPLLVHTCLFGGGYGHQALAAARAYL